MTTTNAEREARNRARNANELARLAAAEPILAAVDHLSSARAALRRVANAEPDLRAEAIPAALDDIAAAQAILEAAS